jgi:hypothetical protein
VSAPAEWFFFDPAEREHVAAALRYVGEESADEEAVLRGVLGRLERTASLVRDTPSMAASWRVRGGRNFSGESLVELLCRVPDYDLDLHIPTKAVLGQSYLIAKINFWKALRYALEPDPPTTPGGHAPLLGARRGPDDLTGAIALHLSKAIYSKLAEELFLSIVTDTENPPNVKAAAAGFLARIWDERLVIAVDDFAPLLESVWRARSKLLPVLGTMLGTAEVFQLFREACDLRFLDYFGSDGVGQEQLLAFEEFLFGLSHEEITRLRKHMADSAQSVMTLDSARELLGRTKLSWMPLNEEGAQALYTSYKKRRVKAHYRMLTAADGPKRTAEEYVMIALLHAGSATAGVMAP